MNEAVAERIRIDGRCFTYVFPCEWEDHCKIGFSRDPLGRIGSLHPRWYEFFDLERGALVEAESVRDARNLELELRRPLAAHNAPAPLSIRVQAGGGTEWFRGAAQPLQAALATLRQRGYWVHPLRGWLREALLARVDLLYDRSLAQLTPDELDGLAGLTVAQRTLRDLLDGYRALEIELEAHLPERVLAWHRRGG